MGPGADQADGPTLANVPVLRRFMLLDHLELGIVLQAGDKEHTGIGPIGEQPIVGVSPIMHHDSAKCESDLSPGLDISHLAIGDDDEARQGVVMVEHQLQLDRPFGAAGRRCPGGPA